MGIYKFCSCKYTNACMVWGALTTASNLISSPKVGWVWTLRIRNHKFFVSFLAFSLLKVLTVVISSSSKTLKKNFVVLPVSENLDDRVRVSPSSIEKFLDVLKKKKEFEEQWIWYINTCIMISIYFLFTYSQPPPPPFGRKMRRKYICKILGVCWREWWGEGLKWTKIHRSDDKTFQNY